MDSGYWVLLIVVLILMSWCWRLTLMVHALKVGQDDVKAGAVLLADAVVAQNNLAVEMKDTLGIHHTALLGHARGLTRVSNLVAELAGDNP